MGIELVMEDQFTPRVVRSNAISNIVWHGVDAEAKMMDRCKECLAEGHLVAVEIHMRIVREIRRQLKRNGPRLLNTWNAPRRLRLIGSEKSCS